VYPSDLRHRDGRMTDVSSVLEVSRTLTALSDIHIATKQSEIISSKEETITLCEKMNCYILADSNSANQI